MEAARQGAFKKKKKKYGEILRVEKKEGMQEDRETQDRGECGPSLQEISQLNEGTPSSRNRETKGRGRKRKRGAARSACGKCRK